MKLATTAALLALVAAMFAAFVPVGANHNDGKLGNVSANRGYCVDATPTDDPVTNNDAFLQVSDTDTANVTVIVGPDDTLDTDATTAGIQGDADSLPDTQNIPCTQAGHNSWYSVTPNGTVTPVVTKLNPTASIRINDSDGVVKGGTDVTATISIKTIEPAASGVVTLSWVRVSGELDNGSLPDPATIANADAKSPTGGSLESSIAIPDGTTEREYTISARLTYDHDGDGVDVAAGNTAAKTLTPTFKLTVGDPGMNTASATLSLGNSHDEDPLTSASDVVPEDGVEPATSGDVWLKVETLNSSGKKANSTGLSTLTVIAPGATLAAHAATAAGTPEATALTGTDGGTNSLGVTTADDVKQTMFIKVGKAGSPAKPGTVTVYAIVIGTDGAARTNDLDVVFTGSAAVVVLGDDVSVGKPAEGAEAKAEISLAANDAGGADATLGTVVYSVTDADGDPVSQSMVKAETSTVGSSTEKTTDDNPNKQVVLVTVDDSADAGVYTVKASLNGVDDSEDTATVTVSGAAANIDLSASANMSSTIGDVITVTATISDEGGNAISDGQLVTFDVSGEGLVQIGSDASTGADGMAGFQSKTKGGSASALFTVTGEGTAVVSAVIGSQTAVAVIVSTAGSAAAAPEVVSLDCLSSLTGFSSYTCGVGSSASELFGLLSGRGATAIHLWNGSMWVRYAVVDGSEIPGSSDFTVTEDDILYISN